MKPQETIYQGTHFIFPDFNGLKIERLVVCENPETKEPLIVYIKVENNFWHQYFLDAGYGFWQNWGKLNPKDDSYDYTEYTQKLELFGKTIANIYCEPNEANSQIVIVFEDNEKLILRCIQPGIFNSESELVKISLNK